MEMARCMLGNLPSFLWGEAMNIIIYTLNGHPTKAIEGKTPFEAWLGIKPNISHLRVFECEAFSYIVFKKRKKLDKRAKNAPLWAMIVCVEVLGYTLHPIEHYLF